MTKNRPYIPKAMREFVKTTMSTLVGHIALFGGGGPARNMISMLQVSGCTAEVYQQAREDFFEDNTGAYRDPKDEPDMQRLLDIIALVQRGR